MNRQQTWTRLKFGSLLLAILVVFTLTGWMSLDYGEHPDEQRLIKSAQVAFITGVKIPGWYNYPSLPFDVILLATTPNLAQFYAKVWAAGGLASARPDAYLVELSGTHLFRLQTRAVFYLFAAFTILWVYLWVLTWRKNYWEALLAGALTAFSWELAYHARWIAPDMLMTQFGALTMLLVYKARSSRHFNLWVVLAGGTAGLAASSKYLGGLFLLPVMLLIWFQTTPALQNSPEHSRWRACRARWGKIWPAALAVLGFAVCFFATSPGILIEFQRFLADIQFEAAHYSSGHNVYTVEAGLSHLGLIAAYLSLVASAPFPVISAAIFALSILGAGAVILEEKLESLVMLAFPAAYLLFLSSYRVMFARNLLVCIPFLAVLAARGVARGLALLDAWRLRSAAWRAAAICLVIGFLAINAGWEIYTAYTIRLRNQIDFTAQFIHYLEQQPQTKFWLTNTLRKQVRSEVEQLPANIAQSPQEAQAVAFQAVEVDRFPANHFNYLLAWFGPKEVNYNYYPAWIGARTSRIAVISANQARSVCTELNPPALAGFCSTATQP